MLHALYYSITESYKYPDQRHFLCVCVSLRLSPFSLYLSWLNIITLNQTLSKQEQGRQAKQASDHDVVWMNDQKDNQSVMIGEDNSRRKKTVFYLVAASTWIDTRFAPKHSVNEHKRRLFCCGWLSLPTRCCFACQRLIRDRRTIMVRASR